MSLIKGIHHIALKCCGAAEFEKTTAFYREVLGLPVARTWGEGTAAGMMLDTGSGIIEIFADGEGRLPQGAVRHFALLTDDVDACVEAVRKAGYPITDEPHDCTVPSNPPYELRIAFCIGPVGEEIEFFKIK
jgi:glyoxylase I family protein